MLSRRRAVAALPVLVVIGCGGRSPVVRGAGQTVYATAGGFGGSAGATTASTSTSAGETSGDTTSGDTTTAGTTAGFYRDPPLADAAIDLTIASTSGTPSNALMAGTGDALGYVWHSYSYDEASGEGFFDTYASLDGDGTGYQYLTLDLTHRTFVAVGTKMTIDGDTGSAQYYAYNDLPGAWYSATSGAAEVTALGPGLSVTLRLANVVFHSEDPDLPDLTFNGTIRSSALPQDTTTSGESTAGTVTTGGSGGYGGTSAG